MGCYYDAPRTWSKPELDVLQVFFRQAAVALENARLYEAQAQRTAELESLLALSTRLRAAYRPEEMYPLLVEHARRLLRAEYGVLALLDEPRETFAQIHDTRGLLKGHAIIPVRGSQLGRVVMTGVPLRLDDAGLERDVLLPPLMAPDGQLGPVAVIPVRSEDEIIGALALGRARGPGGRPFADGDLSVLQGLAEMGGTAIQRARLDQNLQQAYVQMVLALAHATASRDSYTDLHSFRLVTLAEQIAGALGLGVNEIEEIRWGARLHDIGKVGVPDSILHKPGPLTEREQAVMRRHPVIGEEILARVERMRGVAKLVRHHQERWDGTGYPDGLRGDAIPTGARILAVVDAYGAFIERRPYKRARSHEEAIAEIRRCAGSQFDPAIAEIFCQTIERLQSTDEPIA
jgi:putative nucleotidyltransferase with HDIG domain